MKHLFSIGLTIMLLACAAPSAPEVNPRQPGPKTEDSLSSVDLHYRKWSVDTAPSRSEGTVSNGKLLHGHIIPFSGTNFRYFDTTSYLANRAFVNQKIKDLVLAAYKEMETITPGRRFGMMECSNREGGKIAPHHTHQNGLSVDFMIPLLKDGQPYYGLDDLGPQHYLLQFDDNGRYSADSSVSIDFEILAKHLLELIASGKEKGVGIDKVILKLSLKDELFACPSGKKLKATGVYFAQKLPPLINNLHDDHFHVDFELTAH